VPTFRLTIEYDGSCFSGWQVQPEVKTVQGALEDALATMLRKPVRIQGAGRTDAGVHALGQVGSFQVDTDLSPERLQKGLTALAGPDIAIVDAAIAPDGFNARFDSNGKHYRYRILSRKVPSPLLRRTSYFVPRSLDVEAMGRAAEKLVGEHDFKGFRAADCEREKTICTISDVTIETDPRGILSIHVKGVAFLKYMVRVIAGTLIEIGRNKSDPEIVTEIFQTGDRTLAGPTAPSHGLTLVEVFFPDGWLRSVPSDNP
jgi:tRNA pseudouridine38-40 synthase